MEARARELPDRVVVVAGLPGSGKTSLLYDLLANALAAGAWAVIQDPGSQFTGLATHYPDALAYLRAVSDAHRAGVKIEPGASLGEIEGRAVTRAALELADTFARSGAPRPVAVAYDEAVMLGSKTRENYVDDEFMRLLGMRRHLSCAVHVLAQHPTMLHPIWQRLATDLYLLFCGDVDVKALGRMWLVDQHELARAIPTDEHRYIHVRKGRIMSPPDLSFRT